MFAFVAFLLFLVGAESADSWNYFNQDQWKDNCGPENRFQSPIDIAHGMPGDNNNFGLRYLQFTNYNSYANGKWHNNGHTLKFTPSEYNSYKPKLGCRTSNDYTYELKQFHMHWPHSEHAVNGYKYDAEIHFVHELPNTPKTDYNHYAVVAVFLCSDFNRQLSGSGIWEKLSNIPSYKDNVDLSNILYTDLLPADRSYYFYHGSLTTPPCTPAVNWFVLQTPISVPAEFISKLMTAKASHDNYDYLRLNYRSIQQSSNHNVFSYPSANPKTCSSLPSSENYYHEHYDEHSHGHYDEHSHGHYDEHSHGHYDDYYYDYY